MDMDTMPGMSEAFENITAALSCEPVLVAMFGGAINTTNSSAVSTYTGKSNTAHQVLGVLLFLVVVTWAMLVFGAFRKMRDAMFYSGLLQTAMGLYLSLWLFVLMYPSDLAALRQYVFSDLIQVQHMSISWCLITCGLTEVLFSVGRLKSTAWHVVWCIGICFVGMVFQAHPQHNVVATAKHLFLGAFLVFGSMLLMLAKKADVTAARKPPVVAPTAGTPGILDVSDDDDDDYTIVLAGAMFVGAACILLVFDEKPTAVHYAMPPRCFASLYLSVAACVFSLLAVLAMAVASSATCCLRVQQWCLLRKLDKMSIPPVESRPKTPANQELVAIFPRSSSSSSPPQLHSLEVDDTAPNDIEAAIVPGAPALASVLADDPSSGERTYPAPGAVSSFSRAYSDSSDGADECDAVPPAQLSSLVRQLQHARS